MNEVQVSKAVNAPAEGVWALITDLGRSAQIISSIESIRRLDDGTAFEVGAKWRETRTMFGRQATEEMEVTAIDPGRSYTVEADGRGAHYVSTMMVTDTGGGTSRVTMRFSGEPQGTAAKAFSTTVGRFLVGATKKALQQDLDDIAAAAEALS